MKTAAEVALNDMFAAVRTSLPGGDAVAALRRNAFDRFGVSGLPHARLEDWKYSDLKRLVRDAKPLAPRPDSAARAAATGAGRRFAGIGARRLLVVDGEFAPELSDLAGLQAGVSIRATAEALKRDEPVLKIADSGRGIDPAAALNTAFAGDGVLIAIDSNVIVDRPIHLVFVSTARTPSAVFVRSRLEVGKGAELTLLETHEGPDRSDYQVNSVLDVTLGERAQLDHIKVTGEGDGALHIATLSAELGADAAYRGFGLVHGGAVVRNQMFLKLAGDRSSADVQQASLLAERQHADTTLVVDHAAVGSQSREVFKAVVDDEARAVFQGRIAVQTGAQQTDARMMARALLLSDDATANCKPELEIFADDVQCGHGSTIGALDERLKFYLMARGIPEKQAESLLIEAFVKEVIDSIASEGVRDALTQAMSDWLERRG
ncbi:MAG: Fe-S cluster assembly protein SufD [Bradyrhizobium sp.]